jgi:hemerythrin-like domain-containing protein
MNRTRPASGKVVEPAAADGFVALDDVHQRTLVELTELEALVVHLAAHGLDRESRSKAAQIQRFFSTTARQHHEDEERHVFPSLATSADPATVQAVLRLQQDHNWLEEDWMELEPQIAAVAGGQAWYDLDVLREGVGVFVALSRDHIALEESLIYPQARSQLSADARGAMGREMAARRRQRRAAPR